MTVNCIFCGTSLTVDDAVAATDTPVSCPSCKGSFIVGKGGPQVSGAAPLIPDDAKTEDRPVVPGLKKYYLPVVLGILAAVGAVFLVRSIVTRTKKPSAPPASVSRGIKLPGKPVAEESYAKGMEFYKNRNYPAAVVELQRSLRNNPDNIAAYVYLGGSYVQLKKYREAVPYLEKGKNLPLYKKYVYQNLGISWEKMGRYKEAISAYSSLVELEPQNSIFYSRLGFCYSQMRDYRNAEKALQEVLKINPKDQWAKTQLAYVQKRLKKK